MTHLNYTNDFPIKHWTGQYSHIFNVIFETMYGRLVVMVVNVYSDHEYDFNDGCGQHLGSNLTL